MAKKKLPDALRVNADKLKRGEALKNKDKKTVRKQSRRSK